jgi:hypothetical protein
MAWHLTLVCQGKMVLPPRGTALPRDISLIDPSTFAQATRVAS